MRRALALTLATAALLTLSASPALGAFGFKPPPITGVTFTGPEGLPAMAAGSHPFAMTTRLAMNTTVIPEGGSCIKEFCELAEGELRNLTVTMPAGFTGNPFAVPRCTTAEFIHRENSAPSCPDSTAVGISAVKIDFKPLPVGETRYLHVAVYNLVPPPGVAAKLGFAVLNVPVTVDLTVNPSPPYNVEAHLTNTAQAAYFYGSALTIWGDPTAAAHNPLRGHCLDVLAGSEIDEPVSKGNCPSQAPPKAFITLPRRCEGALSTVFDAVAWNSGDKAGLTTKTEDSQGNPLSTLGCGKVEFGPHFQAQPTSASAESPTGFDVNLHIDNPGLENPAGVSSSDIKKAVVALPQGMTANPSQAEGLAVCSEAGFAAEKVDSDFGAGCPAASKIGTVEATTPILEGELLKGSVFLATPYENPFGTLLALYTTIKDPERGISLGLTAKVEPDPKTGQLIATFDNLPQQPVTDFHFHFREGARSPLVTPPHCGTYTTQATFYPWANPSVPFHSDSEFEITAGPGGGPCPPAGAPPFKPGFEAGSLNNSAGAYSPFTMRLTRSDGEQDMTRFSAILPPGVSGKIAGIPTCSEAAIAAAKAKSGKAEIASPSCPAASEIGHTLAGAGVGGALTYVPGHLYLGGPFGGDPLSVVSITPAVAGPFDVGTVVVREALTLDPNTGEVQVDGAASDPIPHILAGIPLKLRDLRVSTDRPQFTINPTSCAKEQAKATLFGDYLDVFNPADDVPVSLTDRYQAASCASLQFKPKLSLTLKGGTRRSAFPALNAELTARPGDANVAGAVVTMPPSLFIANAHIANPCTRVQFNADACPPSSVLGTAKAYTPLLDQPLEGPVYFRSNGGERLLPDVVADLHGQFRFTLVIGILKSRNARITTKVLNAPDVPASKVTLSLAGGKKGLLENNENLCLHKQRAALDLSGQNGRHYRTEPVVKIASCKKKGAAAKRKHSRRR